MAYMKMNYKKNVPHVSLIAEPVPKMTKTVLRATQGTFYKTKHAFSAKKNAQNVQNRVQIAKNVKLGTIY